MSSGLPSVADHFTPECTLIDASEAFFHRWREQRNVWNFAEMFGDEPDRFFRCHPVERIEPGEIHRTRISPQGALAAQIEINIEIAHGQFAQAAVNRLPITAAGKIRFRHCAPMSADFENCYDVIGILFGFQIENQWRKSDHAERGGGKNSALEARRSSIAQNSLR